MCAHASFDYVNVFKAHVNVGFFQGTALPDPAKLLEGTGKRIRHVNSDLASTSTPVRSAR
jgi:hypothetical protein